MGCGCGGKGKPKASKPAAEPKTTGAWKLTAPGGSVSFYDTRVSAQSQNLRHHGGNGIVERNR